VPVLLEALDQTGADLAVASRNVAGGGYEAFSFTRRLASRIATLLARVLLYRARRVADPMSGFFAMRRNVVQNTTLRPIGYKILLEVLVRGHLKRVVEVPYQFRTRQTGESKLTIRQQWEYLYHVLRLAAVRPDDLRFLRFCLVGASGVLVNMGLLSLLVVHGLNYVIAGFMATAAATTGNFILNDRITWQERRASSFGVMTARYLQYWAVTGASTIVQVGCLALLTLSGLPYWLANLVGIGGAAVWNFSANGRWVWKPSQLAVARTISRTIY
jgi:dolichol-phosphate mannosyltransferase